ncbi:MAG TPA: type VI secretion system tube protein Hcp [Bryobacteraceae bacterium]|jgi:type VI secretion system secreted protein Hcp|nr:type VI secretion system tube protein Hcp [Bryobacteraceae bacterium]
MAFDTYLRFDGGSPTIEGEATAADLTPPTGWFEIFSFSWGASNPTSVGTHSGGLSAGKVSVSSFNVMKKTDNASPLLFGACCSGQHYEKAKVVMRKATGTSGKQATFLEYDFTDVMIESIQWSGTSGGDDTPTESISIAFAAVKIQYFKQDTKKGTVSAGNIGSWDLTKAAASS